MLNKVFWTEQHIKNDRENLTGSVGAQIWDSHNINHLIIPNNKVLNIGTGFGYCTRALKEKGMDVYVLDITENAVERVQDVISGSWLEENITELPSDFFDLAISHLVTQHIDDGSLGIQIKNIIRSLNKNGLFSMQFASPLGYEEIKEKVYLPGGECRWISSMDKIIRENGGEAILFKLIDRYPPYCIWFVVHMVKKC